MKSRLKIINWPRQLLQVTVLLLIFFLILKHLLTKSYIADFEAYCPYGGIQALGSFFLNQALSCTMTTVQIAMGILLFVAVLIFSKLFCSFLCPLGTISEWLSKTGKKLKIRITINGWTDLILRFIKYGLLFVTFYFTLQSNELFCKKYDPYYAVLTGFSADVVVWYALITLALLFLGSLFFRMFWCKYICPLGALSNIFKFSGFFAVILVVWLIALKSGLHISYLWPLAIICSGGFLIEVIRLKSSLFPVVRIERNKSSCTRCNLCSKVCHQAIDVANLKVVKHVDCNLCSDCVVVCPVNNTLEINGKRSLKWIAPVAVILLVIAGVILGSYWELPTIDQKWGDAALQAKALVYQQSGLKNVKCFGSSTAFANQMKSVDGILGVATYVKHHKVKILYDPEELNPEKIQRAIFTPLKTTLAEPDTPSNQVTEVRIRLENFFDEFDFQYLALLLQQKTNAIGLISEFDCPIVVRLFFPGKSAIDENLLKEILETKTLNFRQDETDNRVNLDFSISGEPVIKQTDVCEYLKCMFVPFGQEFNDRGSYRDSVLKIYELPSEGNRAVRDKYPYLVSHLSNDSGIVEFRTILNPVCREVIQILFSDSVTNAGNIFKAMNSDSLRLTFSDGEKGTVPNMFHFEKEGVVIGKKDYNQ